MTKGDRATVVVEVQRSGPEVTVAASRRARSGAAASSGELRGVLRLVPLLVGAMNLEAQACR
jgi:hypothetical protein